MIEKRNVEHAEELGIIPGEQFAFKKQHSIKQQALRLWKTIQ